jgi:hypothetical protein
VTPTIDERISSVGSAGRLRLALRIGAVIWLALLVVGFVAPGGWVWGMAGPIGHIENYMISLWLVGLVIAPLLASVDPLGRSTTVQIYLLAILAIVASTARGEPLKLIADGPPLVVAAACIAAVILCHPRPALLLRR